MTDAVTQVEHKGFSVVGVFTLVVIGVMVNLV